MQCTPEQIEEKRRIAQARLRESTARLNGNGASSSTTPVQNPFRFKASPIKHNSKPYDKQPKQQQLQQTLEKKKEENVTVKMSLISEERFGAEPSCFSQSCIEIFKTIPTRHYDPQTRLWSFNIKDHDLLKTKLTRSPQPRIFVEELPKFVIKCLKEPKRENNTSNYDFINKIDPELGSVLMPFQLKGVEFVIHRNGRALIADDMGVGKTFQALAAANYYISDWPLLIIATSATKGNWEETITKYLPSVPLHEVVCMNSKKDYIGDASIVILTPELAGITLDSLLLKQFGVLILDESQNFKTYNAKRTKVAAELAKNARRVILLSGTPILAAPKELYTQLDFIEPNFFGSFFDYSRRYCEGQQTTFGWNANGASNLQELNAVLCRRFMIRRTKDEVLKMLPVKRQEIVKLDVNLTQFSPEDRKCLTALANNYRDLKGCRKHAALLTFFAETAKIKIPSVCSYILQLIQTPQKFLVFAHHKIMLDAICAVLRKSNVDFMRIDGQTSSEQKTLAIEKFQLQDSCQVACLSITAANAGITLTAAHLVIFAELHWSPGILSQAESRAHRIGQTHPVSVRYLVGSGTADDSIWPMLEKKQNVLNEVQLAGKNFNNVSVSNQDSGNEVLTENLNITNLNVTQAGTLDISTYFKNDSDNNSPTVNLDGWLDDGMDDIFFKVEPPMVDENN